MSWIIFALLNAFFESAKDVTSKRGLKSLDPFTVSFCLNFFSLFFLIPFLIILTIPQIGPNFLSALLVSGTINTGASLIYMKAIKESDLSITTPMLTFTPLFLLLTSPIILGEFPSKVGLAGVILIVLGSYLLNLKERHNGFFSPFKALIAQKGPKLMLIVAFIWAFSSNFDKIGIQNSSPIFWTVAVRSYMSAGILALMLFVSRNSFKKIIPNYKTLIPIAGLSSLSIFFQMTAVSLTLVAYVISIKRTSTLINVIAGAIFFKEKGLKERFAAAFIMLIGVLLITLG